MNRRRCLEDALAMEVCSDYDWNWDITEELFLQPVSDLCSHRLDAIVREALETYLREALPMGIRRRVAQLYSQMRNVGFSVTGASAPIVHRDCGPQLLVMLLERLPPECFLHAISECEDLRLDLLWAFFSDAAVCSLSAESRCWVNPHPDIQVHTRGSKRYNAAMRHKLMCVALFIMNCSRVESRYEPSKIDFKSFFTACAWAQNGITFQGLQPDAAMLLAMDGMMSRDSCVIMNTLTQQARAEDGNVSQMASQCTPELLRSLICLKMRPTYGPGSQLLPDILKVLDFPHLVKLIDSSFAPCCSVTLQPLGRADYSRFDTYSGPKLHPSVRTLSESFLVDTYLTRVQGRFDHQWNEFIVDKDVSFTDSKAPHLQVSSSVRRLWPHPTLTLGAVCSFWSGTSCQMPAFMASPTTSPRRPDVWSDSAFV